VPYPRDLDISCQSCITQSDVASSWAEASIIADENITTEDSEINDSDNGDHTITAPLFSIPVAAIPVALQKRKRGRRPKVGSTISESGSSDIIRDGKKQKSQGAIHSNESHI
jgi:hypothetical protein